MAPDVLRRAGDALGDDGMPGVVEDEDGARDCKPSNDAMRVDLVRGSSSGRSGEAPRTTRRSSICWRLGVEKPPSGVPRAGYEAREGARCGQTAGCVGPEVPVQTIEVRSRIETIPEPEREVIGDEVSYRLGRAAARGAEACAESASAATPRQFSPPRRGRWRMDADVRVLESMVDKFCWRSRVFSTPDIAQPLHPGGRARSSTCWRRLPMRRGAVVSSQVLRDGRDLAQGRTSKGKMRPGGVMAGLRDADEVELRARRHRHGLSRQLPRQLQRRLDGLPRGAGLGEVTHALVGHTRRTFERA